jgi:hypothetical protein
MESERFNKNGIFLKNILNNIFKLEKDKICKICYIKNPVGPCHGQYHQCYRSVHQFDCIEDDIFNGKNPLQFLIINKLTITTKTTERVYNDIFNYFSKIN